MRLGDACCSPLSTARLSALLSALALAALAFAALLWWAICEQSIDGSRIEDVRDKVKPQNDSLLSAFPKFHFCNFPLNDHDPTMPPKKAKEPAPKKTGPTSRRPPDNLEKSSQPKYQTRQSKSGTRRFISDGTARRRSAEEIEAALREELEEAERVDAEHCAQMQAIADEEDRILRSSTVGEQQHSDVDEDPFQPAPVQCKYFHNKCHE